jgi:aminoglycoside phosphotransferase (APT) family kinase protein
VTTLMAERVDEDALRQCLEGIVRSRLRTIGDGQSAIAGIHRQRFERSSLYACDILTVELATGDELKIFLKNFGGSQPPKDGLPPKCERELRVYRDLLTEANLDAAAYYASVWDKSEGRFWLLLEFVHGMRLRRFGDVGSWVAAARWLGRMQGYFAQQPSRLQACDALLRHDARFFWAKAERALHAVAQVSTSLADRLAHILSRYDQLVDVMVSQPRTFVHGAYRSRNIVVDRSSAPPRVCPTGWGQAAIGAPLYDLAFLSDRCEPPLLDRLWDAYGAEAAGCGLPLPDREDMRYIVDCFRLHKVIQSLSESVDWGFRERSVTELVARGERLSTLILGHPGAASSCPTGSPSQIRRTTPEGHLAARAWQETQPGRGEPERIDTLQVEKKAAVYRLHGVGPGGSAVIAKWCRTTIAAIERTVYEDILPHVPVTALHYYGSAPQDDEFCWLFLEDAGEEHYSPYSKEHGALAGRWLGLMHTSAARIAAAARLPDRGPSHYLEHLRSARHAVQRNLANPALTGDDVTVLQAIVAQCDLLESRWSRVETCCEGLPSTLVHGDFRPKNVHVRTDQAGLTLFPLDWETAGWGVPAPDLVGVDLGAYWTVVRECWPTLDLQAIQRLANLGTLFRRLAAMNWESASLKSDWLDRPMASMRVCHARLSDAIQAMQWTE